jgi:polysaccharide export outer membrane protein
MKKSVHIFTICLFLMSFVSFGQDQTDFYRLATDDVISVIVFNEAELDVKEAKISQNGSISVPLLGQVDVAGKTVTEVQTHITELFFADYLKEPRVSVGIVEYRPFYINGEVDKPGSYSFRTGMTVQMAITIAGGFTERASKNKIFLLPENSTSRPKQVALNDVIRPGDVITIEESFF